MFPYSDADVQHGTFPYVNVILIGICALVLVGRMLANPGGRPKIVPKGDDLWR